MCFFYLYAGHGLNPLLHGAYIHTAMTLVSTHPGGGVGVVVTGTQKHTDTWGVG